MKKMAKISSTRFVVRFAGQFAGASPRSQFCEVRGYFVDALVGGVSVVVRFVMLRSEFHFFVVCVDDVRVFLQRRRITGRVCVVFGFVLQRTKLDLRIAHSAGSATGKVERES